MKLENGKLLLETDRLGSSMARLFDKENGREILYRIEPNSWQATDHILFPMVGRMLDGIYEVEGETYEMPIHGLIRFLKGSERRLRKNEGEIVFSSDKNTLKRYPFPFRLTIHYLLKDSSLIVSYSIENPDPKKALTFGFGAHPGFAIPTETLENGKKDGEGNFLDFGREMQLTNIRLKDGAFPLEKGEWLMDGEMLDLNNTLFERYNTVILDAKDIDRFTLLKKDGSRVMLSIGKCPFLAIWRDFNGSFVAIEPWWSLPDVMPLERELSKKKTLLTLGPKERFLYSYSLTIS